MDTLNRRFSWHMVNGTVLGWPFVLEAEIRKMLDLLPDPTEIEIVLRKKEES
jgi:hypothetical protein